MSATAPRWRSLVALVDEAAAAGRRGGFTHRGPWRRRRLSLADTLALSLRFARLLEARGIGRGAHVVLWGPSGPDWVAAFLGAARRGVAVVPLDDAAGAAFAARVQARVRAPLAVVGRSAAAAAREALGCEVLVLEDLAAACAAHSDRPLPDAGVEPADTLQVLFTSGTTSEPRGVVVSHRNVLANLAALERPYRRWNARLGWLVRRRTVVVLLPLSHAFGQAVGLFATWLMGLEAVFVGAPGPVALREAIRDEGAWVVATVPRFLSTLRRDLDAELAREWGGSDAVRARREAVEDRSLAARWWTFRRAHRALGRRFVAIVAGGAALPEEEQRAWEAMGFLVAQGYGLTETAPIVSVGNPFRRDRGRVGRPLAGQEVRLASDGEVLVRGANVTEGVLVEGGVERLVDGEGWLHTGDLGELGPDGALRITGRSKDVIVTALGLNVHARDVERAFAGASGVREAVVVGLPGAAGDAVHAVLLLEPGARDPEAVARDAVARANEALPPYQRVRSHSTWPHPDFPRTAGAGKVIKREVLDAVRGARSTQRDGGLDALVEAALGRGPGTASEGARPSAGAGAPGALAEDARLSELGLGSLDLVELAARVEGRFQVDLDDSRLSSATTVGELRRLLAGESEALPAPAVPFPRWAGTVPGRALGALLRTLIAGPVMLIYCPLSVTGRERLDALPGPALLVGNHVSYFDAPVVFRALPRRVRGRVATAMATEPFRPLFTHERGSFLQRAVQRVRFTLATAAFRAFPMPRGGGFRASLAHAIELAEAGAWPLVFPEGRMTASGEVQAFRGGVGVLVSELGLPVVPFRIAGLERVFPVGARWPRRGRVEVRFGPPLAFPPGTDRAQVAAALEAAVRSA